MWTISEVKARARAAFKANYWPCVAVALLAGATMGNCNFRFNAGDLPWTPSSPSVSCDAESPPAGGTGDAQAPAGEGGEVETRSAGTDRIPSGPAWCPANPGAWVIVAAFALGIPAIVLLRLLLLNPLAVGCANFFLRNTSGKADFNAVGTPFRSWKRVVRGMFLRDWYLFLWSLPALLGLVGLVLWGVVLHASPRPEILAACAVTALLWIPAAVKSYSYRLVPYLLADDPALSGREAIDRSRALMDGNKARALLLDLSFAGWLLLSILTLGILLVFHAGPYIQCANAGLYRALVPPRSGPAVPPPLPDGSRRGGRGLLYGGIGLAALFMVACCAAIVAASVWMCRGSEATIVIRGQYDTLPPTPEDIRREWGVIIHDVLHVGEAPVAGIFLQPLRDGNFRLHVMRDAKGARHVCTRTAQEYARLKAEGVPPRYRGPDDDLWAFSCGPELFPAPPAPAP